VDSARRGVYHLTKLPERTASPPLSSNSVQRLEIAEEKRLILNWSQAVHASRRSWPERARRASAGAPRPAASVCGGGRSLGAAESSWRRGGWLASGIGSALRTSSGRAVLFPGGEVVGFAPRASKGGAVLRETVVPSEATPSRGSLRVAQEPLNPAPAPGGSAAGEAQHRWAHVEKVALCRSE
jgi:hypothetical protein